MVPKSEKCHPITLVFNELFPDSYISNTASENITEEKILGIVIDNK